MAKKAMSLAQWCKENGKTDILAELDCNKNPEWYSAEKIRHNAPGKLNWKCEKGHEYQCEVIGRTLFGLKCPTCNPKESVLPVGTKHGCLTIINSDEYYNDKLNLPKKGKRTYPKYKCKCKCGKISYWDQRYFLETRHKYCTQAISEKDLEGCHWAEDTLNKYCGLAVKAWEKKNRTIEKEYAHNYFTNFEGTTFGSLKILECIDDNHMELHRQGDFRTNNSCRFVIYKIYKYKCYLCGDEGTVKCSQLYIDSCTNKYDYMFECHCHEPSVFERRVIKALFDNNVPYRVEYAFNDLPGRCGLKLLRFDFAVLNEDDSVKCLIECQGEQHNKPIEFLGGERTFKNQSENDALKKEYVQNHDIKLIEISYKYDSYDKVVAILKKHGIL